jgi:hypothetical protein
VEVCQELNLCHTDANRVGVFIRTEASYLAVLYVDGLSSTCSPHITSVRSLSRSQASTFSLYSAPYRLVVCLDISENCRPLAENLKIASSSLVMSSPSTTASSM